jgi:hypothetical protein
VLVRALPPSTRFNLLKSNIYIHTVPNTSLRSRVLGKSLIVPFPSKLPPQTVLDCILDTNWRDNGILHVLDVVQWKGQDVGDCETPFRFVFVFVSASSSFVAWLIYGGLC